MNDDASPAVGERPPTATDAFFASLDEHARQPLLKTATGTLRFDLVDEQNGVEHWYVKLREGQAEVSHSDASADAVLRIQRRTFDGMASGTVNFMAAVLRGEFLPEGDLGLVALFQRLFPGPPRVVAQQATHRSTTP